MAIITRSALSGSTNGKGIKVTGTTTGAAVTAHTAVSGTTDWDEVYIWAVNTSASDVKLTIEYGGTTDPDDHIEKTIPAEDGLYLVVPGLMLQNGLLVKAFAATGDVIVLHGYANKIVQS